ncbi:MAG: HlyD family efflux transporter periplasmic adaptor subunit [Sphingobacteriales bacterium]|nr:MAG: HlyD family efflux transporter periplasmic adaptor subunit [Sphingobacteriales bacterium]
MNDIKLKGFAKYGTLVTIAALLATGALTWFIKYPETVSTRSRLSGTNAPKPIIARSNTRVVALKKAAGDTLQPGDIIATLESTANPDEVLAFAVFLDRLYEQLEQENYSSIKQLMQQKFSHLGELQGDYQALMQAYLPFRDYVLGDYVAKRKSLLGKDRYLVQQSRSVLNERKTLNGEDLQLSRTTLAKNKKLLEEKLISEQEYRELNSRHIGKQMSAPQMKSEYIANEAQVNAIRKELIELDNEVLRQKALFMQVALALKSSLDDWKKNYLLVATAGGRLAFASFLQENQIIEAGKIIGYIIPGNSNIYLETRVPQTGFGKVSPGQAVLLRFDAYPWQEFGAVKGTISYISPVPADSGYYLAKVMLPRGLQTNYNKAIPFKEGLLAQSEIVTKDLRLAESLYYNIIRQIRK